MWKNSQNFKSILSLVIKTKVVQNVNRMSENIMSVCQYVNMSTSGCQDVDVYEDSEIKLAAYVERLAENLSKYFLREGLSRNWKQSSDVCC